MTTIALTTLEEIIADWHGKHCEERGYPWPYVGEKTYRLMAQAALAVLEACAESQRVAIRDGYLSK